ncbi:hypothetical protein NY486_03760, partial [Enterobacter hormaechei]|nr:hypothetical protein [Enterobacter hormaechei]
NEYGRLVDDDDDEDVEWDGPAGGADRFVTSRFDRARPDEPAMGAGYNDGSFNIATSSTSSTSGSSKPRPANPFANPFLHDDDFAAGFPGTASSSSSKAVTHAPRTSSLSSAATAPPLPKRPT